MRAQCANLPLRSIRKFGVRDMLFDKNATQLALVAERAEEDSLALWREVRCAIAKAQSKDALFLDADSGDADNVDKVPFNLSGRYRVGDGSEYPCEIAGISPIGLHVKGPRSAGLSKWCTANITSVGIVEGIVVRAQVETFIVGVIAPARRLSRLAQRLSWHMQRGAGDVTERRASERVEMHYARATIETDQGRVFSCDIFDLSEGGAALHLGADALYFWADQPIKLDQRAGRVLRHFPGGFVVKFD